MRARAVGDAARMSEHVGVALERQQLGPLAGTLDHPVKAIRCERTTALGREHNIHIHHCIKAQKSGGPNHAVSASTGASTYVDHGTEGHNSLGDNGSPSILRPQFI